jgi:hypothetical protein
VEKDCLRPRTRDFFASSGDSSKLSNETVPTAHYSNQIGIDLNLCVVYL